MPLFRKSLFQIVPIITYRYCWKIKYFGQITQSVSKQSNVAKVTSLQFESQQSLLVNKI